MLIWLGRLVALFGLVNMIKPLARFEIRKRSVGFVIFFIGALITNIAVIGSTPSPQALRQLSQQPNSTSAEQLQVELTETHVQPGQSADYIVGTVENKANIPYRNLMVHINLYDESDVKIGETFAKTYELEAGGIWKFAAPIFQKEAKRYQVSYITATVLRPSWLLRLFTKKDRKE